MPFHEPALGVAPVILTSKRSEPSARRTFSTTISAAEPFIRTSTPAWMVRIPSSVTVTAPSTVYGLPARSQLTFCGQTSPREECGSE